MAIAMVLRFVDVLCDDSLKSIYIDGKKMGYQFDVRLACYRGHFLSVINEISLKVDGEAVPEMDMSFSIHGKDFGLAQMKENCSEFWRITEPATIKVLKRGGLKEGEHDIDFHMVYRSPYMPIGDKEYMPWDSSQEKTMILKEYLH